MCFGNLLSDIGDAICQFHFEVGITLVSTDSVLQGSACAILCLEHDDASGQSQFEMS